MKISKWVAAISIMLGSFQALAAGRVVPFQSSYNLTAGSVMIRMSEFALYYVVGDGTAIRYPVAVAKRGKEWTGWTRVEDKAWKPAWSPPAEVKRDHPELPDMIPGGSPSNPMGVAAILLEKYEIAIHGTNKPSSIGTKASYGCIRMHNSDVADLYGRVGRGTPVLMLP